MPVKTLRAELAATFGRWTDDLPLDWRAFFAGVAPDAASVDAELLLDGGRFVYPGRKGKLPPGAPVGAHALRPFEHVSPEDVRVVVVGQDPYLQVEQATGRSFEEGGLLSWSVEKPPSTGLRRIVQAVAHLRRPEREDYLDEAGWAAVVADRGDLGLSAPAATWDRWETRGVLFVNAAFTATSRDPAIPRKTEDTRQNAYRDRGHRVFWKPVVNALLAGLAKRPGRPLVLVTWGQEAEKTLAASQAVALAGDRWGTEVGQIVRAHPDAAPKGATPPTRCAFLTGVNPLREINEALAAAGSSAVDW